MDKDIKLQRYDDGVPSVLRKKIIAALEAENAQLREEMAHLRRELEAYRKG